MDCKILGRRQFRHVTVLQDYPNIGSGHMTVDTFGKPDLPTFLAWQ
jgi:hypothetical protein